MAVAWEFAPNAITTSEYGGAVTTIDEWPPAGGGAGEVIQSGILAPAASDSFEVDFDMSGAPEFDRGLMAVLVHRGTAGPWSVSAQFKIGGVNEGSAQVDSTPTTAFRYSFFYFEDVDLAAVEADPTNASILFTATNTHSGNQRHQVDAVRLFISPLTGAPPLAPNISAADVVQATGLLETFALWSDGGNVDHLPDLIDAHHYVSIGTPGVFDDDHAIAPASMTVSNARYVSRVDGHPLGEYWVASIVETPANVPDQDSNSEVSFSGFGGDTLYSDIDFFSMHGGLGAGTGVVGGFVFMCDDGNTHHRTDGVDDAGTPIPDSTTFLMLFYLDTVSADMRFYLTDNEPLTAGHKILDENNSGGANSLGALTLGNRPDGTRPWQGRIMASYLMAGSLTENEAIENANWLGDYYQLFEFGEGSPGESPGDSPGEPGCCCAPNHKRRRCC